MRLPKLKRTQVKGPHLTVTHYKPNSLRIVEVTPEDFSLDVETHRFRRYKHSLYPRGDYLDIAGPYRDGTFYVRDGEGAWPRRRVAQALRVHVEGSE